MPTKVHLVKAMVSSSHVWMWELDYKKSWVPKNWCFWTVVLEKTLESPLDCKIKPVNPKGDQSWIFIGRTDAEAEALILGLPKCKELTYWKRPWCWERLKVGGEGDNRGWDGCMSSPTQWTWVWVNSGSWWWTGRSALLQSMGLQRVGHDWVTEQQQQAVISSIKIYASVLCGSLDGRGIWGDGYMCMYVWAPLLFTFYSPESTTAWLITYISIQN